jgi:hypothetical protein
VIYRSLLSLPVMAVVITAPLAGQAPSSPAKASASTHGRAFTVAHTADGLPDLQGIWTNATITPLERPAQFASKPTVTEAEAKAFEQQSNSGVYSDQRNSNPEADRDHAYNALFFDRGTELAHVDGVARTSLIIDPPDGKIPPMTAEGTKRNANRFRNSFNSVKDRPLGERCLMGFGSTSGPPMLPVLYNNNYQIVESKQTVMILVEMVHDVRYIHMDRTQHLPQDIKLWLGDSIGHWEGDTLVVDTTNFTDKTRFRGSSPNLHVIERFSRVAPDAILYRVTIDDPSTFTRPWTLEYPFLATSGPIYEYACQEGNYAMTDIMGGARKADQASPEGGKK